MSRAVMQQAFNAMSYGNTAEREAARIALREALAQPEQEPVALDHRYAERLIEELEDNGDPVSCDAAEEFRRLLASPRQRQEEQEPSLQEQIGDALQSAAFYRRRVEALQEWQRKMRDPERTIVCDIIANGCTLDSSHAGDRYTSPPQRQPLTHEQRLDLLTAFAKHKREWNAESIFIDMVEAAHGIKPA